MTIDLHKTRQAAIELQKTSEHERNAFLKHLSAALSKRKKKILRANEEDVTNAKNNKLPAAFIQRLVFGSHELELLRAKVRNIEKLKSHLGEVIEQRLLKKDLQLKKVRVPLGVLLVIYESRPEVTIDVAVLCIKSGNAAFLKGGSEARRTSQELFRCIQEALRQTRLSKDSIALVRDRKEVAALLKCHEDIDLVVARGGYGLVRSVMNTSTIPVLAHAAGGARIYVDKSADLSMAEKILVNAKISKPAACNSLDTILVHKSIARQFILHIVMRMNNVGVRVLGDTKARQIVNVKAARPAAVGVARESDWKKEFLGLTVAIKVVGNAQEAIEHINRYGKRHSEGLVARDPAVIKKFTESIDAAALFINASTRLHDGYVFGLGSEMGISAGKLHARGPVGLKELTTYRWEVYGKGHTR